MLIYVWRKALDLRMWCWQQDRRPPIRFYLSGKVVNICRDIYNSDSYRQDMWGT